MSGRYSRGGSAMGSHFMVDTFAKYSSRSLGCEILMGCHPVAAVVHAVAFADFLSHGQPCQQVDVLREAMTLAACRTVGLVLSMTI